MRYLIVTLLLIPVVAGAAVNEWILGEPQDTYEVEEWVLGQPAVNIDGTAAPTGGQVITVIMSSIPGFLVVGLACAFLRRKAV